MWLISKFCERLLHLPVKGGRVSNVDANSVNPVFHFRQRIGSFTVTGCENFDILHLQIIEINLFVFHQIYSETGSFI